MRILIVDDNPRRISRIISVLSDRCGVTEKGFAVVTNASDARVELEGSHFDLLLLDVLLPKNAYDASPASANSLDLLTEIVETDALGKPRYIVGVTAFESARSEVSSSFSDRTWSLLLCSEESDDWLDQLTACVNYVRSVLAQGTTPSYDLDVLILTALRAPEMEAVHRLPWKWGSEEPIDDVTFVRRGSFSSKDSEFSVVSSVAPRMGMVPMALLASKLIEKFRPRLVVMPGICAGVRGRVELGDVVFGDMCWDYQVGKHHVNAEHIPSFQIEPYPVTVESGISAKMDQLGLDREFWRSLSDEWHDDKQAPSLIRAPIASGSSVLANGEITKLIVQQQRKVAGIEMEMYALYSAAAFCCEPRPAVIGLKGVCDFADENKKDGFQSFAAYASANAMRAFLERFGCEILGKKGVRGN